MNLSSLFDKKLLCALLQVFFVLMILEPWNINSSFKKDHSKGLSEAQKHEKSLPGSSIIWWECCPFFHGEALLTFHPWLFIYRLKSSDIEDVEDVGDCDDNFVKAPLSNNITGNHPIIEAVVLSMHKHQWFWSWNPFKDALPTKSCKSHS